VPQIIKKPEELPGSDLSGEEEEGEEGEEEEEEEEKEEVEGVY
jgi:hypothetical protein